MENQTNKGTTSDMLEVAKKSLLAKMGCGTFDPDVFLVNLAADTEAPNYYLETKYRIMWFRVANPDGRIETELLSVKDGLAIVKATIVMSNGTVLSCSHGTCVVGNGQDPYKSIETAETKAIGRALNLAGYGTVYCGAELTTSVCEAPVSITQEKASEKTTPEPKQQQKASAPTTDAPSTEKAFDIKECLANLRETMTEREALETKCPFSKYAGISVKQIAAENPKSLKWTVETYEPKNEKGARYKVACEIVLNRYIEAEQNRGV